MGSGRKCMLGPDVLVGKNPSPKDGVGGDEEEKS